jgi:hypothetical protein
MMADFRNALAQQPTNRLAYEDRIGATPRNEYLGALADFLAQSYAPQRTQQMQGVAQFLGVPAVSQTLDRLSYGEPLTTGAGMTTRVRPEALEAAMTLAPLYRPAGMVAKETVATTKGMPVGMSTKAVGGMGFLRPSVETFQNVNQQMPSKALRRFNDGGVEVGYNRGDSKILVTMAPSNRDDRMLSASLENIGGYPSGTGEGTMAYVDALESVLKDARGKPVFWDGFTSESIQSDKARAIYERLKAAGIPFEKNVFEGRSKDALSLTQEQLLNIDFDNVRANLSKLSK